MKPIKPVLSALAFALSLLMMPAVQAAQTVNPPDNPQQYTAQWQAQLADLRQQISKPQHTVIAHYDHNGQRISKPGKGGFYRVLLGYLPDGRAVVQDFYQKHKRKQTDPIVLKNGTDIRSFENHVIDDHARVAWYDHIGNLERSAVVLDGKLHEAAFYNTKENYLEWWVSKEIGSGNIYTRIFDNKGNLRLEQVVDQKRNSTASYYYPNGQIMYREVAPKGEEGIYEYWSEDGKSVTDEDEDVTAEVFIWKMRGIEIMQNHMNQ